MQQVEVIEKNDYCILKLSGSFSGGCELKLLKEAMREIIADNKNKIYLDLQEIEYITSIIIGLIISTNKKLKARGGCMFFYRPNTYINELFEMTRLSDFITTCYEI